MLPTTTSHDGRDSMILAGEPPARSPDELMARYRAIGDRTLLGWTENHLLLRRLGSGGQGVVYLCRRLGADGFHLPVALKVFSPERYDTASGYDEAMACIARVAVRVAQIQQDNLVDVHNFAELDGLRLMEMEWIDGYDLHRLLTPEMLTRAQ
jgi:serine/threonine protein kinase